MMMNLRITSLFSFVSLALIHPVFLYSTETENEFLKRCPPFPCGKFGEISFPFSNRTEDLKCGLFLVDGCDDEQQWIKLTTEPQKRYKVENISKNYDDGWNITITDTHLQKLLNSRSCEAFNNSLSDFNVHTSIYESMHSDSITLLKCNHTHTAPSPHFVFEYRDCPNFTIYYNHKNIGSPQPGPPPPDCAIVNLPVNLYNSYDKIFELLTATFSFQVHISRDCNSCGVGEAICQFNNKEFKCSRGTKKGRMVIIIALIATAAGIGILIITVCYLMRRKVIFFWKKKTQDCKSIEAFLRSHGPLALKRYRYSEVKKMTGTFKIKLGQGGYGSVFKGVLPDGCLVAVKVLKESKSNGEEFINEVASISRTSHINIVTLLGFCFDGSKRALVYEFIANGSLEMYICEENSSKSNHLGWETLFDIAVGIARGLEYLHRGCNTRILHFDIKPHNILLDENFCPKISDFGLAKVCTKRESIISMKDARGTIGYIAPEVFLRNIGGVSHKSDVYSYGMLVLEMVGGRKNISVEADNTSEIYFPDWIYRCLEVGKELGLGRINNEEEKQIARKMVLVSLWCIQTDPSNRPPMSRVVEMLHGSGTSLPIPPKPYLFSPFRPHLQSMADFSTETIGTS